ncbi:MAG: helix-turn-helix domain-containing protein [Phenylobacterium sp.]
MSEEVYTVEQFAERLKVHPKTVLRFIRDGRVRAVKVGKSYRILRTEMEAVTGVTPDAYRQAMEAHRGMLERKADPRGVKPSARVTGIVDLPEVAPATAERLARLLPAARTGQTAHDQPMNLNVAYDPATRTLKIIIVASLPDTAAMLKMVEAVSEL